MTEVGIADPAAHLDPFPTAAEVLPAGHCPGVNGPGEASDADIGIAGGINEALLFKNGQIIKKIPQDQIVSVLKTEILAMIKAPQ